MDNRFVSGGLSPDPGDRAESGPFRKGEPGIPEGRQLEFQFPAGAGEGGGMLIAERTEPDQRGPDGRFLPGNQCGKHSLTGAQREALEEIRQLAPRAAEKMADMLDDDTVPAAAKIRIMEMILDRTYGKPEAAVKLSADLENGASSRARLDAIAAWIRLEVDG